MQFIKKQVREQIFFVMIKIALVLVVILGIVFFIK